MNSKKNHDIINNIILTGQEENIKSEDRYYWSLIMT